MKRLRTWYKNIPDGVIPIVVNIFLQGMAFGAFLLFLKHILDKQ